MLEIKNLHKSFGKKPALRDLSFSVEKGQIYGLLGHNGAGKSTTLGIILAMIAADKGSVRIGGVSVQKDRAAALRKVGAIFESPAFYEYMTGWQNLKTMVSYSGRFDEKLAKDVVEKVRLTDRIHHKVGSYSHGMRQRLALAQALLPEPEVLLLDEPTDGLDPEGIKWFRDFIINLRNERGMTVLFNSHLLGEVEQMCERVAIIKQGQLVHEGSIADLEEDDPTYIVETSEGGSDIIKQHGGTHISDHRYALPSHLTPSDLNASLVTAGIAVHHLARHRRSLEDLYLSL